MSALESSVYSLLAGNGTIAGLVSDRIYPDYAPIGASNPCIVYQKISGDDVRSADGANGMSSAVIQISCWADTYAVAASIRAAVVACLRDYIGTVDGVTFRSTALSNDFDSPVVDPENEECNEYGKVLDFTIWYV